MKKRNKIVAFLLAGVIAAGHGSVVYAAGYGSVVYEDVAWDLCALNEERMKLEVQEKNTDNDAAGNDQADIEERESPQSTSEYADIGIASVLNYVNLRAEPSVESEALGKLYNNSAATVLETVLDEAGEEWYLVSSLHHCKNPILHFCGKAVFPAFLFLHNISHVTFVESPFFF